MSRSAPPELVDKLEASRVLKVPPRRLGSSAWRRHFGLPAIRVGGSIRFDLAELRLWLESRREKPDKGDVA